MNCQKQYKGTNYVDHTLIYVGDPWSTLLPIQCSMGDHSWDKLKGLSMPVPCFGVSRDQGGAETSKIKKSKGFKQLISQTKSFLK